MNAGFATAWIVDDLPHCRAWLRSAAELAFPGIRIDEAESVASARPMLLQPPDLAMIDLGLPDGSGTGLIEALTRSGAATVCVVSTVFDDDAHLFPALRAGAQGYVLKDQPHQDLAELLRGIAAGQPPLSPSIARRLLRHFQPLPARESANDPLTPRETEVLRLIAKGFTAQQVAATLSISPHTAAGYVKDIYRKLSVSSRAEATLEAARMGLVRSESA